MPLRHMEAPEIPVIWPVDAALGGCPRGGGQGVFGSACRNPAFRSGPVASGAVTGIGQLGLPVSARRSCYQEISFTLKAFAGERNNLGKCVSAKSSLLASNPL